MKHFRIYNYICILSVYLMNLLRYLTFLILFTLIKAHGRLIIMAVLGLTSLWMIHLLAQDYQNIRPSAAVPKIKKLLSKRSTDTYEMIHPSLSTPDPLDCTKSFACQVAVHVGDNNGASSIIHFIRNMPDNKNVVEMKKAMKIGTLYRSREHCRNIYNKCPYTAEKMLELIKIVGG